MCVTATASAYANNAPATLQVGFATASSSSTILVVELELTASAAKSHMSLVNEGTVCKTASAGTHQFLGTNGSGSAITDADDVGSLSVQVFSQ
jgi:hypothetical protein